MESAELFCSYQDLQTRWGVSRSTVKRILAREAVPVVKFGSLARVPLSEVVRVEGKGILSTGMSKDDKHV